MQNAPFHLLFRSTHFFIYHYVTGCLIFSGKHFRAGINVLITASMFFFISQNSKTSSSLKIYQFYMNILLGRLILFVFPTSALFFTTEFDLINSKWRWQKILEHSIIARHCYCSIYGDRNIVAPVL